MPFNCILGLQQKIFLVFFVPLSFYLSHFLSFFLPTFFTFYFLCYCFHIINYTRGAYQHRRKHTIYFFNIMVLDGSQHNFSFLFFYKIFAIGLIDGIMHFFTHFKICLDGKIDFFFEPKNAIARYIIRPAHVCVL